MWLGAKFAPKNSSEITDTPLYHNWYFIFPLIMLTVKANYCADCNLYINVVHGPPLSLQTPKRVAALLGELLFVTM